MSTTVTVKLEISEVTMNEIFSSYDYVRENEGFTSLQDLSQADLKKFLTKYIHSCIDDADWYDIWEEMIRQHSQLKL